MTCYVPEEFSVGAFPYLDVVTGCTCKSVFSGVLDHRSDGFLVVGQSVYASS